MEINTIIVILGLGAAFAVAWYLGGIGVITRKQVVASNDKFYK